MKKLIITLLTTLILLSSCELSTEEVKPTIKLVTVALNYKGSCVRELPCTLNDQRDLVTQITLLCEKAGYQLETYTLTEDDGNFYYNGNLTGKTFSDDIKRLFTETLPSNSQSKDFTIFYYSGHGDDKGSLFIGLETSINIIPTKQKEWDLIYEDTVNNPNNKLTIDQLHSYITPLNGKKLIILDSCFSGHIVQNTDNAMTQIEAFEKGFEKLFSQEKIDNRNTWYITAASKDEESVEVKNFGHGVFTYHLLQGLGFDTTNEIATTVSPLGIDKEISLNELFHYIDQNVKSKFTQHTQKGMSMLDLVLFKWN